ncbi:MAG TPA: hypothetical protein VFQ52_06060 [Rhizomicrobium sp.]|nr:hypothetical protein [Rhizomicrobium sp.]
MALDSVLIASSVALFGAGIGAWVLSAPLKAVARQYLRFAAMLLAALAVAAPLGLGDVAALLLLPLASASLALSALARFARPLPQFPATLALVAALMGGIGAMLLGFWVLALVPVAIAGLVIIAAALHGVAPMPVIAGAALLASGLGTVQQGAGAGVLLLCAASLIGLARGNQLLRSTSKPVFGAPAP